MSLFADARDATKEPPAYLDPRWVLMMRKRLREFQETGRMEWYKRVEDWSPAKTPGRSAPVGALNINGGN
jgi:hypothetical protein